MIGGNSRVLEENDLNEKRVGGESGKRDNGGEDEMRKRPGLQDCIIVLGGVGKSLMASARVAGNGPVSPCFSSVLRRGARARPSALLHFPFRAPWIVASCNDVFGIVDMFFAAVTTQSEKLKN